MEYCFRTKRIKNKGQASDFDFLTSPEEIIEEVRAAIKDWRKTATELQIPIKLLESYSIRWDEL